MSKKIASKLFLASALFLGLNAFVACAGGGAEADVEPTELADPVAQAGEMERSKDEAMAKEEENHELRKKIFEAKVKLGIPTEDAAEEPAQAK